MAWLLRSRLGERHALVPRKDDVSILVTFRLNSKSVRRKLQETQAGRALAARDLDRRSSASGVRNPVRLSEGANRWGT